MKNLALELKLENDYLKNKRKRLQDRLDKRLKKIKNRHQNYVDDEVLLLRENIKILNEYIKSNLEMIHYYTKRTLKGEM